MIGGHMFFEVLPADTERARSDLATSSNGLDWTYEQIVLREDFHLSYPYVFEWQNTLLHDPRNARRERGLAVSS